MKICSIGPASVTDSERAKSYEISSLHSLKTPAWFLFFKRKFSALTLWFHHHTKSWILVLASFIFSFRTDQKSTVQAFLPLHCSQSLDDLTLDAILVDERDRGAPTLREVNFTHFALISTCRVSPTKSFITKRSFMCISFFSVWYPSRRFSRAMERKIIEGIGTPVSKRGSENYAH